MISRSVQKKANSYDPSIIISSGQKGRFLMEKQIVYVLSTNFAGSHLMTLQLGSHSRCASIGELNHFRKKNSVHRAANHTRINSGVIGGSVYGACHQCETDDMCPVFSGIKRQQIRYLYDTIFNNLAAINGDITTVIDSSKKVNWACSFLNPDGYTRKYIHLIRDPRAVVRRWMLSYDAPRKKKMRIKTARRCWRHAWDILTGNEPNVYVWKWLYQNRQIQNFIKSNNLDARVVTYHDLVFKTDEVLAELMNWIGYGYETNQKNYWSFVHHGSVKSLYMQPPANNEKIYDQRWKSFLSDEVQNKILKHRHINLFLERNGLVLDAENGLLKRGCI